MRAIATAAQIGTLLAARRKALKLSQAEVAARLGLSQNRLSVLERDSSSLTARQLLALLNVLGLQMTFADRDARRGDADY